MDQTLTFRFASALQTCLLASLWLENVWRIRVGSYRVLYEVHDKRLLVLVIRVGNRKDVYRKDK